MSTNSRDGQCFGKYSMAKTWIVSNNIEIENRLLPKNIFIVNFPLFLSTLAVFFGEKVIIIDKNFQDAFQPGQN